MFIFIWKRHFYTYHCFHSCTSCLYAVSIITKAQDKQLWGRLILIFILAGTAVSAFSATKMPLWLGKRLISHYDYSVPLSALLQADLSFLQAYSLSFVKSRASEG
jgi:hypothetical protein